MKFCEMEYKRPDADSLIHEYAELVAAAKAADNGDALLELFARHCELNDEFEKQSCLSSIRHTLDTRDEFYDDENNFFDRVGPSVANAQLDFYRALLENEHKDALAAKYGQILLDKMNISVNSANEDVIELMQEENELSSRYQKLYATCTV